jgi:hypothetical protein
MRAQQVWHSAQMRLPFGPDVQPVQHQPDPPLGPPGPAIICGDSCSSTDISTLSTESERSGVAEGSLDAFGAKISALPSCSTYVDPGGTSTSRVDPLLLDAALHASVLRQPRSNAIR